MRNIALFLKYDGSAYHGWQVQKNARTVAQTHGGGRGARVVGHPVHMTGCGRTDAGVHARVYVANFRTDVAASPSTACPMRSTRICPPDIVVTARAGGPTEASTPSAPASARSIPIRSTIPACATRSYVNRAWFYPKHLDEAVMQQAAAQFVGTHDFAAVRSVGTDVKSTVRTVYHFDVERRGELISPAASAQTDFSTTWRAP